jgi:Tfp pilus assembly protein PilO
MSRDFHRRKTLIRWVLAAVIVIDLGLLVLNWRMASAPHAPQGEIQALELQRKLMAADVARGDDIRRNLPAVQAECDRFFNDQFRPVASGYSGLIADLGSIASTAGLKADATTFAQHKPDAHGVVELDIGESVEGSYPNVVAFFDGLEHSHDFYILDSLSLSSNREGSLKLSLQLRTFFRS